MAVWTSREVTRPLSRDQIKRIIGKYDTNRDGKISKEEFKEALRRMGLHFCSIKAWRAFRHADSNGDGFISEEEMIELLKYACRWGIFAG